MLCSDGVLESWNDNDLKALFSTHNQTDKLTENIKAECSKNSRDNFTAIVFKIKEANIINTVAAKIISPSQTNESNLVTNQTLTKNKKSISGFFKMRIPIGLVLIIAVFAGILFFKLSPKTKKPDDKKVTKTENSNNNANTELQNSDNNAEKKFQSAMKKGEDALREGNYQAAIDAFKKAHSCKKDDTTAKAKLKEAQDKLKEDSENKELQAKFESAMKKGEEALSAKTYQAAIVEFTKALLYKKDDTTAKAKLKEAQDKLNKDSENAEEGNDDNKNKTDVGPDKKGEKVEEKQPKTKTGGSKNSNKKQN